MSNIIAITLAIFAAATVAQAMNYNPMPKVDMNLADLLLRSSDAMQKNPQLTTQCFNTYKPKLDECAEVYNKNLNACQTDAATSTERVNKEVASSIDSINQWREDICGTYSKCNQGESDPHGFFACNTNAASAAMTNSYSIQTMSKDKMEYVSAQYQMIQYNQKSCSDGAEATYVKTSKQMYDYLQQCLLGETTPPPTETTETTPVTEGQ